MFDHNSFPSQDAIFLLLSFRQSIVFGFLERRLAVFMKFCHNLISRICQNAKAFSKLAAVILEQLKIMLTSITKSRGDNLSTFSVSDYLCFLGMVLLLPLNAVFGFLWTRNRLFADIHQYDFEDGIAGLECFLAW